MIALSLACGPDAPGGTEGATTVATAPTTGTVEVTTGMTGTTSTTAGVTSDPTTGGGDGLAEHSVCPNGDECASDGLCVQSEGASICGPQCYEFGPGPAAGRCPQSPFQVQTICTMDHDQQEMPGVCLITCGDASHCPDPGMVCVTCPDLYKYACDSLWQFAGTGPNICAWPGP